jgi:hypothetical protein
MQLNTFKVLMRWITSYITKSSYEIYGHHSPAAQPVIPEATTQLKCRITLAPLLVVIP